MLSDKNSIANKIKLVLYSILAGLKFNVGGQLGTNEILALADSFSLKKWKLLFKNLPEIKKINIAYAVFLLAQMISDIVNHSSPENYIRGWANIVMAIIVTNLLTRILYFSPNLITFYLIGEIARIIIFGKEGDESNGSLENMEFMKFYLSPIINAIILLISLHLLNKSRNKYTIVLTLFLAVGLFSIAFDARSNGMLWILTVIFVLQVKKFGKISFSRLLPYLSLFVVIFYGLYFMYASAVLSGEIGGAHTREQFKRVSNPYNPFNLIITGRAETIVALTAIYDEPIFGHGSWAPDKQGRYSYLVSKIHGNDENYADNIKNPNNELIIPSHSVLLGAWVTSGILGFLSILYIFIVIIKGFFSLLKYRNFLQSPYLPITIYFFFNLVWTFLFSPLPHIKQTIPIMIALIIVIHARTKIFGLSNKSMFEKYIEDQKRKLLNVE